MPQHRHPVTPAEAKTGRCRLCNRKLLAHPLASVQDIERLGDEWGAGLVHRSCAVLGGLMRPLERRSPAPRHRPDERPSARA